jgi:copper homeostasis protein
MAWEGRSCFDGAMDVSVEVCVDSVAGARAAAEGGADRIELCSALELGGCTPSLGLLRAARDVAASVPIFAMLRVRAGDFVVDRDDLASIVADVEAFRRAGADGLVFGALTADGEIDREALRVVQDAAADLPLTFHRAVDCCRDVLAAVDVLVDAGVRRVLTSGGAPTALVGQDAIASMVARAAGRIAVMAGSGVRASNVAALVAATGVSEVHLSAGRVVTGPSRFGRPECGFAAPGRADHERRETDAGEIRAVRAALGRASR